jgi:hypothetical protein
MLRPSLETVLCPWCVKPGGLSLAIQFYVEPVGSFSLAGVGMKLSMREVPKLACSLCQRSMIGRLEGSEAVFPDPHVEPERG